MAATMSERQARHQQHPDVPRHGVQDQVADRGTRQTDDGRGARHQATSSESL